jgi:hypothetical protein
MKRRLTQAAEKQPPLGERYVINSESLSAHHIHAGDDVIVRPGRGELGGLIVIEYLKDGRLWTGYYEFSDRYFFTFRHAGTQRLWFFEHDEIQIVGHIVAGMTCVRECRAVDNAPPQIAARCKYAEA